MNSSVIFKEYSLPENIVFAVVEKARKLYKSKESRLEYCKMRFGEKAISEPDVFYKKYFKGNQNVSKEKR